MILPTYSSHSGLGTSSRFSCFLQAMPRRGEPLDRSPTRFSYPRHLTSVGSPWSHSPFSHISWCSPRAFKVRHGSERHLFHVAVSSFLSSYHISSLDAWQLLGTSWPVHVPCRRVLGPLVGQVTQEPYRLASCSQAPKQPIRRGIISILDFVACCSFLARQTPGPSRRHELHSCGHASPLRKIKAKPGRLSAPIAQVLQVILLGASR